MWSKQIRSFSVASRVDHDFPEMLGCKLYIIQSSEQEGPMTELIEQTIHLLEIEVRNT